MTPTCAPSPVEIETARHRIRGTVAVPAGERLSDYANDPSRTFFAVIDATIAPIDQPDRERPLDFILVNRAEIGLLTPGVAEVRRTGPVWDEGTAAALGLVA